MGQSAEALREFETALKATPNRYRAFLGIARAANADGDHQKASEYYGKLVNLAKSADTERPETQEAKTFLAKRPQRRAFRARSFATLNARLQVTGSLPPVERIGYCTAIQVPREPGCRFL
jgi:tetratricopeptide (TPR) repeat protein